ncbi:hypothetical protein K490DRAFT_59049 [Saccharata proteae CBS 121410]|uniref:Uncharacterized protein n=1 Tax=Saccharata proteae CBS 121410 TaxID=1314787 RepID=A0A9P4LXJ9_9PEZI|nr:hypothetical protein K490DRAFT_59049 [Saccharata proteae CBS 121410]
MAPKAVWEVENLRALTDQKTWRELTTDQIMRGLPMFWTEDDKHVFRVHAAKHGWDRSVTVDAGEDRDIEVLQKCLGLYTISKRLNRAIAYEIARGIRDDISNNLRFVVKQPGPHVAFWPPWTCQWFLDRDWNGSINPPEHNAVSGIDAEIVAAEEYRRQLEKKLDRVISYLDDLRAPRPSSLQQGEELRRQYQDQRAFGGSRDRQIS